MALATITDLITLLPGDAVNNDYWNSKLNAAISIVKNILNRELESASYTETGFTDENGVFYVKEIPLTADSITLTLNESALVEDTDFTANDTTGEIDCDGTGEYSITYTGGYSTIPDLVKEAIAQAAYFLHCQRGQGIAANESAGGQSLTYKTEDELKAHLKSMLKPYICVSVGWINEQEYKEQS